MTGRQLIVTLFAIFGIFVVVAFTGGLVQKWQDAGVATSDPGFVPSTGQINNVT